MSHKKPPVLHPVSQAISRRTAIKTLAGMALTPVLASCGNKYGDIGTVRGTIENVVVLMMENRSFDHYLGALALEGRDVDGIRPGLVNPHPNGEEIAAFPDVTACLYDPPHGWEPAHRQFNDGKNDGFVKEHAARGAGDQATRVMGYLARKDLPITYALADQGVVCDRWFCSLMTSTWPNRFYSLAAQNNAERGNNFAGDYSFESIFHRLNERKITWKNYYGNLPFTALLHDLSTRNLVDLEDFYTDAAAGTLPSFSVVDPIYGYNSDHPAEHPLLGQLLIASIYDALANSPQYERTLFIITYDENGGFFDHVPPPKAPDLYADQGFDQLGFRVPSMVMGPWVKEMGVSHTVYDHTSVLATLERLWDLEPLTPRDEAANDLFDTLDMERIQLQMPRPPITLPVLQVDEEELTGPGCTFTAPQSLHNTSQPELEAYIRTHHPELDRSASSEQVLKNIVEHARQRGLWKPKRPSPR